MRIPDDTFNNLKAPEINVVPLIDVVFCIMVVFIVASLTLTRNQGLAVNLPNASAAQNKLEPDAVISVTKEGQIAVNRIPVDQNSLVPEVEKILASRPQNATNPSRLVVLRADLGLTHGKVVDVMNALQQVPNVSLAIAARRTSQQ